MSDRVQKPLHKKTIQRNTLIDAILLNPSAMRTECSYCESHGYKCFGSEGSSSRCFHCVKNNQPRCDAQGLTPSQLRRIADQHGKLESELEAVEEERRRMDAKIQRLRQQKKLWLDKMMRAVSRGIDSVEELERIEQKEAEEVAQKQATPSAASSSEPVFSEIEIDPVFLQEGVELSPSWFVGMGVSGPGDIVEQAADNSSSA